MASAYSEEVVHPPVVERLRTAIRQRPVADEDLSSIQVRLKTDGEKIVAFSPFSGNGLLYDYDYYFPPNARQTDLYLTIGREMVEAVMGGLSSNCVTFGAAETGKTHTLFGDPNEYGLIHDTVRELFARLEQQADSHEFVVTMRYWDMNKDGVSDNLVEDPEETSLNLAISRGTEPLRHSVFRDGFGRLYLSNLREVDITNFDDFEEYLNKGNEVRIRCGNSRMARWHGFVQLSVTTTDKAKGERCVLRNLTFVHMKGTDRVGEKGFSGDALRENSGINVSVTLLCAGVIHSLEYQDKRRDRVRTKEQLHDLIAKSESFFMECRFSQMMSQLVCGHEVSFVVGCIDPLSYSTTIGTLESLQLFRQLRCACLPVVTPSEKGRLLRKLRLLEGTFGGAEVLASVYNETSGRPRTEEEEALLELYGQIEGWQSQGNRQVEAERHEEELKQRSRARLTKDGSASTKENAPGTCATHGDRKKIYLNAAKTATYEGQWADGLFDGFGEHIQANYKYRGEFRRGKREGEGSLFIRKGDKDPYNRVYEGEWLNGMRDGRGTQWCASGEVYEGEFACDKRHGNGRLYCTNGDVVEGSFAEGLNDGWAVLRQENGDWFEGYWSRGMREGPGVWHYTKRRQCYRGEWSKNNPVMGTVEDDEEKVDNTCSGFIPRVSVLAYEKLLAKERDKLNERRRREYAAEGREWVDPVNGQTHKVAEPGVQSVSGLDVE
ncbi:kinesin [Strigomonas culicis]|uniref:MORN repeat-containing protein 3 n=1 Tax=Strigomonas culicis TaxID=28005 RepID=S9V2D2_9TRYP|nr:kinesin [Strigomonas culicis]|eukprot:EPY37262.1 kinesin [Strigomonas culicis]